MVSVEVLKSGRDHSSLSESIAIPSEGLWYSIGSSELCDINCSLFRPDENLKIGHFQGFVFVRFGTHLNFGYLRLSVTLSRGVKISFLLGSDSGRYGRAELMRLFDSFSFLYLNSEYSTLRKSVVTSSELLQDFSLSNEIVLTEICRQISSHVHLLSFQVGTEISRFFQLALALLCDFCFEGPLFDVLNDDQVTEVVVNGRCGVWVESNGQWKKVAFPFQDWSWFENWLLFQSSFSNADIFGSGCFSDFVLRSGARVHVCRSPVARSDGYVSIRRHRVKRWKLMELVGSGFMTEEQGRFLKSALENRMNIMVVGPTSSGKTTLLGALAGACVSGERILLLEDTPELKVEHDHIVYLQTVSSLNGDDDEVTLNALVRQALRMRPDRIVVGECRGDEVFALLNALQTGHSGSMCTLHARTAQQGILRLKTLLQRAEPSLSDRAANKLISLGLDLVVCVTRSPSGERKIAEICDVETLLCDV